jgi:hypothetical protein
MARTARDDRGCGPPLSWKSRVVSAVGRGEQRIGHLHHQAVRGGGTNLAVQVRLPDEWRDESAARLLIGRGRFGVAADPAAVHKGCPVMQHWIGA